MRDLRAAHRDVRAGNVADTRTAFHHDQFREFFARLQIEYWLDDLALPVAEILQVYVYRVCHGNWYNIPEVCED